MSQTSRNRKANMRKQQRYVNMSLAAFSSISKLNKFRKRIYSCLVVTAQQQLVADLLHES